MGKLSVGKLAGVREVAAELDVLRLDGPSGVETALPKIRELTGIDTLVCACPVERATGWELERLDAVNLPNPSKFRQLAVAFFRTAPRRFGWYDPLRPEPEQRNVVVAIDQLAPPKDFTQAPIYTDLLVPGRLHDRYGVRALICEGSSLLAWFGGFHGEEIDAEQRELVIHVIPALRRRLALERRLRAAPLLTAALAATLEQLGSPAFVVNGEGRIHETNEAGKALLASRRADVSLALQLALGNKPSPLTFDLTPLADRGAPDHWLAVVRSSAQDTRVANAIRNAVRAWKLTPRQREVLALVIRGESNTTIATTLRVSERAVEQHITSIFDRAAVDSRSALVSRVLIGR